MKKAITEVSVITGKPYKESEEKMICKNCGRPINDKTEIANRPHEMVLRGRNKYYGWILYECPKCELPHDNFWFKKNKLKPGKVFTCESCGAKLRVPKYK